ncbi:MAG: hypothetical protein QOE61_490, partial [Micromonosporaceae bacterium]|nr:hypothetical protein [Micromonosporaceae bacterium]
MGRVLVVDGAVRFGQPQLHTVPLEQRRQVEQLLAVERPLVLPDHDRVEPALRVGDRRQQRGRLGSLGPGQPPGVAEKLSGPTELG